MMTSSTHFIAFEGSRCLAQGPLAEVALQLKTATEARPLARFMVFKANNSELIDFDLRGTPEEMLARLALTQPGLALPSFDKNAAVADAAEKDVANDVTVAKSGPGRPKLGVVAREVTLLPRHWAWLSSQPGGASVALRKLVEQARRDAQVHDERRLSQEASYRFMSAMAGSLEGFEEAARALFAADRAKFDGLIATWPSDIQMHLQHLAQIALKPMGESLHSEVQDAS
jgi:hypothetical protein